MSLTPEQRALRVGKLTASSIGTLLRGSEEDLLNLWRTVSGDPNYVEPDFSDNWPVQLGVITEELNLNWFAKKNGAVSRRGEVVTHANGWAACTLDGWSVDHDAPIQAKHCIQYKKLPDILDWYAPQFHWEMFVTNRKKICTSVIIGALEPQVTILEYDEAYGAALVKRAEDFMNCVWNLTPPVKAPEIAAPVRREEWRTVAMEGNNEWAHAAVDWLANKDPAEKFEAAKEIIKDMMAADVGIAHGYGIIAKRAKNSAISIKEGEM